MHDKPQFGHLHGRRRSQHPTPIEYLGVMLTLFLLTYDEPNYWFVEKLGDDFRPEQSTGIVAAVTLIACAALFFRMSFPIESLARTLQLEPAIPLLVTLSFVSVLWSSSPSTTLTKSISMILTTVLAYLLFLRFTQRELIGMLAGVYLAGLVVNYFWVFALPRFGIVGDNWTGVTLNRNILGRDSVLGFVLFAAAARTHRRARSLWWPCAFIAFGLMIGANSKTALVAGLVMAVSMPLFTFFRARGTSYGAVAAVFAMGSVGIVAAAIGKLDSIVVVLDRDPSLTGRTELWSGIIGSIAERPILGYGFRAFWTGWFGPNHEIWIQNKVGFLAPAAHNAFLDIALELGVVGLALFSIALVRLTIRGARIARSTPRFLGLLPLLYAEFTVLFSLTDSGVYGRTLAWVLFIDMACFSAQQVRRLNGAESNDDSQEATAAAGGGSTELTVADHHEVGL